LSEVVWFSVWNNRPRVIWVPDDYEKIQDAIWYSENGDTIMVRRGEYDEALQMFEKNVSIVSEEGPEVTIVNSTDAFFTTLTITGGQDSNVVVRGFTFINTPEDGGSSACLNISGSNPRIVNNIMTGSETVTGIFAGNNAAFIRNNLIINLRISVTMGYSWGDFINNMIIRSTEYGFWNAGNRGQALIADNNLFWDSGALFGIDRMLNWGEHNLIDADPRFVNGTLELAEDSPAKDGGDPSIRDIDASRSDIGVYGGPYAYTNP
jgi:hypothetical protein